MSLACSHYHLCYTSSIGLDKSGYQVNIFLISQRKHILWVLIRSASFLFLHKNICCGYSLEAPRWGASNEYHNMFSWWNKKKYQHFWIEKSALIRAMRPLFTRPEKTFYQIVGNGLLSLLMCNRVFVPCCCTKDLLSLLVLNMVFFPCWCFTHFLL